jgi:hypothetical protein
MSCVKVWGTVLSCETVRRVNYIVNHFTPTRSLLHNTLHQSNCHQLPASTDSRPTSGDQQHHLPKASVSTINNLHIHPQYTKLFNYTLTINSLHSTLRKMTLPENTLKYDDYSLNDLRKFATDRKLPGKCVGTKVYIKKTNRKKSLDTKEKVERRKLLAALRRSDATATFRFFDLPLELREYVYGFVLVDLMGRKSKVWMRGDLRELKERVKPVSEQLCEETCAVFERQMDARDAKDVARSRRYREECISGLPVQDTLPRQAYPCGMASGKSIAINSILNSSGYMNHRYISPIAQAGTGKSQSNVVVVSGRDGYVMEFQLHEESI